MSIIYTCLVIVIICNCVTIYFNVKTIMLNRQRSSRGQER